MDEDLRNMTDWFDLARDARQAANLLVQEEKHRSATARAYYAAYSKVAYALVAEGLDMPPGREGPKHSRVRPVIETSMPDMEEKKREELSRLMGRLYTLRINADYKPSVLVEGKESREAISILKTIFEAF